MTLHCLYSSSTMDKEELEIIKEVIGEDRVSDTIYRIEPLSIVIPRYRFVPFGSELEKDVEASGSSLLNSYREHRNIAETWEVVELILWCLSFRSHRIAECHAICDACECGEWSV